MAKDSYWFRHDSTAGRGLRMRKMAHIYGHWGKGVYWDVIEILRDQSNYCFEYDNASLQMLCDLIGCKDEPKFITWMRDCVQLDLFQIDKNKFYSLVLCENMSKWETKKRNGSEPKSETETKPQANQKHKIIEDNIIKEDRILKNSFSPPIQSDVVSYFTINGYTEASAIKAFNYYSVADWKDSKGKQVKNWKQKMQGVWFKEENKIIKSIQEIKMTVR